MRFLKNKIRLAQEYALKKQQQQQELKVKQQQLELESISSPSTEAATPMTLLSPQSQYQEESPLNNNTILQSKRGKRDTSNSKAPSPTKNIVLNYARAIANFAISKLALPFLNSYIVNGQINHQGFVEFVTSGKANIGGIKSFKTLLVTKETDSAQVSLYKEIFRMLSITFVRDFSMNWIACGRVTNKDVYLKYRVHILQKLENPEDFIYFIRNQVPK